MRHLRWTVGLVAAVVVGLLQPPAWGQTTAGATGTVEQLGSNLYEYDLTLTNTGSTPIGTFWFAWVPGYDLLPHIPSSVSSPAGWSGSHMEGEIGVSSVLWTATSPLQPGQSLSGFVFDTSDAPSVITGPSGFLDLPVDTSYLYSGGPFSGGSGGVTPSAITTVPEPGGLLLAATSLLLLRPRRSR